ncbi:MAG TPA: hypothetical protein VFG69_09935, partial [Nannocystaceae bacterium]|nr:hypothetical protein [Nannocystaceae bacterium]
MLQRFAHLVARRSLWIVIVAVLLGVAAAIYGAGVARTLASGGFEVTGGEAAQVAEIAANRFGQGDADIIALVRHEGRLATDAETKADLTAMVAALAENPDVSAVASPLGPAGDALLSADRTTAMLAISVH